MNYPALADRASRLKPLIRNGSRYINHFKSLHKENLYIIAPSKEEGIGSSASDNKDMRRLQSLERKGEKTSF